LQTSKLQLNAGLAHSALIPNSLMIGHHFSAPAVTRALEMTYMQAQLDRSGTPAPRAIGIDEIAIRKGHT
jgi:hypothetical protein